ncbi:MAG: response regulator transcription factor [Treponema sp.]|jgi:DNA-binding NarL/FixJ family response regulator|nr:response regulator transcription factor [Treponema sp.]
MIRIVIISGKDSERYTIQKIVDSQFDISVVGQGRDGYDALKIVPRLKPDIVLLDETLPMVDGIVNGVEIIPVLMHRSSKTRIIILTASFHENLRVLKAISYGASGYLLKNTRQEKIIAGIKTVYNEGCLMTPEIAAKAFRMFPNVSRNTPKASFFSTPMEMSFSSYPNLSKQELQIVVYITKGLSNKEIGKYLALKEGTVRNYITSILEKTGLKNRTQIAVYAYNTGLIKGDLERRLG